MTQVNASPGPTRIFVAGATGVLGRRVVDRLVAGGHAVVGLSRSDANAAWLADHGAEARPGDLFDAPRLRDLTADCDAILHLATAIPTRARTTRADWAANDRIRREGTRALVDAAVEGGCKRFVAQSVTFVYGDRGGAWVDEDTPAAADLSPVVASAVDLEGIVRSAADRGLPAVVLRCGMFYAHDSAQTRDMLTAVRKGFMPIVGPGTAYWNVVHADDAADAVCRAATAPDVTPGLVLNVCDDEPVTYRDLVGFTARTLGARPPRRVPVWLARWLLGSHAVGVLVASARCRNARAKAALGWQPRFATYRDGYAAVIERWAGG